MLEAMGWALLGASSLLIGALIAFAVRIGDRLLGFILAFGAGVLISAVAYELVEEALTVGAPAGAVGAGFALGALVFFLGAVLDGIPESVVIGASLLAGESASVAVIVAVFLSNIPESISASSDLIHDGWSRSRVLLLWIIVVVASTLAAGLGYVALEGAAGSWVAAIQAFAAGAILTMLADEMIPEAFENTEHNKSVGLALALGFALSAVLSFSS